MVREYMKKALVMAKQNKGVFWALTAALAAIQLLSISTSPQPECGLNPWVFILTMGLGLVSYYWLMNYVLILTKKRTTTLKAVFKVDLKKLAMMVGVYFLILIPTLIVGVVAFILGAILIKYLGVVGIVLVSILAVAFLVWVSYLGLRYQFVLYAYIDQPKISFREAFAYSWKITDKKLKKIIWFEVKYLLFSMLLIIPVILPMLLYGVGQMILANILFSLAYALVYIIISQAFGFFYRSLEKKK